MRRLTVFTPTYNRAYCLHHLYESLCKQENKNFMWLVVDDGSTDNTRELVESWEIENKIKIKYIYKINGGMHTAHNLAYKIMCTELNVCIDSDDRLADGAVGNILSCWDKVKDDPEIAGIVGLDINLDGGLIGTPLPDSIGAVKFHHLYQKHGVLGDKKIVLKTSLVKHCPSYPEYEGERLVPLDFLYYELDQKYSFVCFNEVWAEVDYQVDGSSATINQQYFKSPRGFRFAKLNEYCQSTVFRYRIKALVHFGFTSLILKDYMFFIKSPNKFLSLLLFPVSFFFYIEKKKKIGKL